MASEDERKKEWWRQKRWSIPGLLVVVGLVVLVIAGPPVVIRASRPDIRTASAADQLRAENDLRGTLVTMLAGIAVAAGSVVAALNFVNSRAALEETQRQNRESYDLQRRGQVTERFSKAIEQLGARGEKDPEKVDIRLGGIYSLEQIARDSGELHWPIVEILTAFIREHTKANVGDHPTSDQLEPDQTPAGRRVDIHAALTVLRHRQADRDQGPVDLGRADLQGANLAEADLHGANLAQANLRGANLAQANLRGANLAQANLQDADARLANLEGAWLGEANLQRTHLTGANLQDANLGYATCQDAWLGEANLQGASLGRADLQGASLTEANLQDANLFKAKLQGAFLLKANLRGANLAGAELQGAEGLTQEQLDSATCDEKTKLPPGLTVHMKPSDPNNAASR